MFLFIWSFFWVKKINRDCGRKRTWLSLFLFFERSGTNVLSFDPVRECKARDTTSSTEHGENTIYIIVVERKNCVNFSNYFYFTAPPLYCLEAIPQFYTIVWEHWFFACVKVKWPLFLIPKSGLISLGHVSNFFSRSLLILFMSEMWKGSSSLKFVTLHLTSAKDDFVIDLEDFPLKKSSSKREKRLYSLSDLRFIWSCEIIDQTIIMLLSIEK